VSTLYDLCSLVRSKNAGPFVLTFDLMLSDEESYQRVRRADPLKRAMVAQLYGREEGAVSVVYCDNALAIKISMPRPVVQCDPGDGDCYGGQQYVPLLSIVVD
jgi:hypothetical protein